MKAYNNELQIQYCSDVRLTLPSSDPDAMRESLKGDL